MDGGDSRTAPATPGLLIIIAPGDILNKDSTMSDPSIHVSRQEKPASHHSNDNSHAFTFFGQSPKISFPTDPSQQYTQSHQRWNTSVSRVKRH